MKMEYTIVSGSSNPNDFKLNELDVIWETYSELELAQDRLRELEGNCPSSKGSFKIFCRQVTDWCEVVGQHPEQQ